MKLKEIRPWEWVIGVGIFLVLVNYVFWGYYIERTEKFMRAGAANSIIWRSLNARALGITGSLESLSNSDLGIPINPEPCEKPLGQVEFPARCRIFNKDNGGKAVNCRFWWLGRNCRIVYISDDVFQNQELKNRIFQAFRTPCRILSDPARTPSGNAQADQIAADFRSGFGCDSWGAIWPVETLMYHRVKDKTVTIERVVKR